MPKNHLAILLPYANLLACFMKVKVRYSDMMWFNVKAAELWNEHGEWCQCQTSGYKPVSPK